MSSAAPIHLIPERIASLATAVAAGGRVVTRAFVDHWSGAPEEALVGYLQSASCAFHLLFTKSSSKTILFVFHVRGPVKVIFDATVSFQINTSSDSLPPEPPPTLGDTMVVFVLPSFLIGFPTRQQLDKFAFGAASTSSNTLLLALGPNRLDMLAIMNPERGKKASVRYSPGAVPGPVEPINGKYSLAWVLALVRTLGSWMDADVQATDVLPTLMQSDEQSVAGVLFYLLNSFVSASQALSQSAIRNLQLPDIFQKTYTLSGYQADVKLRLKPDGTLSDTTDFGASQLTLRIRVRWTDVHRAEITAIPNELSVSGRLAASFVAVLRFDVADTTWADLLHVDRVFVPIFFQSSAENAAVFRVSRDEFADTDVVILTGILAGSVTTVVLSARFTVNMNDEPPAIDLPDINSIQILAIERGDGRSAMVGFDAVAFLLRYLFNFRHWMGVLG